MCLERIVMYKVVKRLIDFMFALLLLVVLSPILLLVAIAIKLDSKGPVLFKQVRTGKHGVNFNVYKFRTMSNKKDENGKLLPDEKRLNKFGKFLRKTSIDELPELNVVQMEEFRQEAEKEAKIALDI